MKLNKINIQLLVLAIAISLIVGTIIGAMYSKDLPLLFPGQIKAKLFMIEEDDIFADPGDNDISYSCGVAAWDAMNIDSTSARYGVSCEGTRYSSGGRCLCVVGYVP